MSDLQKKIRHYDVLCERLKALVCRVKGLHLDQLGEIETDESTYPFWRLHTQDRPEQKKICLSGGIHGDEPAGVEAVLKFLEAMDNNPERFDRFHFTIFPCINPFGYEYHSRGNESKTDLNREFDKPFPQPEVQFLKEAIAGLHFDFAYECHEDIDSPGYYLYEMSRDGRKMIGPEIVERIQKICPINMADVIEEMPARDGVIHSSFIPSNLFWEQVQRRGGWPQTIYMSENGTDICITAETPTRLDMPQRVAAHLKAIETALALI